MFFVFIFFRFNRIIHLIYFRVVFFIIYFQSCINVFEAIQSRTSIFNVVIPKNHANAQVTDPRLTISHPIWPWPSICLSVICIFAYMIQQQNSLRCVRTPPFPNGSMQSQSAMHFAFPIRCIEACTGFFFLSDEWPDLLRFFRFGRHSFFCCCPFNLIEFAVFYALVAIDSLSLHHTQCLP